MAHNVMAQLITDGKVTRGYLGVMIQDLTPGAGPRLQGWRNEGRARGDVPAKSPAAKAGLQSGDIITQFDGAWSSARELKLALAQHKPGEKPTYCACCATAREDLHRHARRAAG